MTADDRSPLSNDCLDWANAQINEAMASRKERLKHLSATPAKLRELQRAILVIGSRKLSAYRHAIAGASASTFAWVARDPELAAAIHCITRQLISCDDIDTLPAELSENDTEHDGAARAACATDPTAAAQSPVPQPPEQSDGPSRVQPDFFPELL